MLISGVVRGPSLRQWAIISLCVLFGLLANPSVGLEVGLDQPLVVKEAPQLFIGRLPVSANKVRSFGNGSCMPYARVRSGLAISGSACDILRRTELATGTVPVIGSVMVTSEGPCGHVAVVEEVGDRYILISEQNYKGLYIVSRREIALNSDLILGYIYK